MPDMQSPVPAGSGVPPMTLMLDAAALARDDIDYAFGCECADPSLQIAQWAQDERPSGAEGS